MCRCGSPNELGPAASAAEMGAYFQIIWQDCEARVLHSNLDRNLLIRTNLRILSVLFGKLVRPFYVSPWPGLITMPKKKNRETIPPQLAARVLFLADRTCCVCRVQGKLVQI